MRTDIIFEAETKEGKIRLTDRQWKHIIFRHPEMPGRIYQIEQALLHPTKKIRFSDETIK